MALLLPVRDDRIINQRGLQSNCCILCSVKYFVAKFRKIWALQLFEPKANFQHFWQNFCPKTPKTVFLAHFGANFFAWRIRPGWKLVAIVQAGAYLFSWGVSWKSSKPRKFFSFGGSFLYSPPAVHFRSSWLIYSWILFWSCKKWVFRGCGFHNST